MQIKMYKLFFLQSTFDDLNNKLTNKKIVLYCNNNSCLPQIGICHIAVIYKNEYWWNFFVGWGNGLVLLGMPDCKWLKLLNVNCQTRCWTHTKNKQIKQESLNKEIIVKITSLLTAKLIQKQTTLLQVQTQEQTGLQVLKPQWKYTIQQHVYRYWMPQGQLLKVLRHCKAIPGTTKMCSINTTRTI